MTQALERRAASITFVACLVVLALLLVGVVRDVLFLSFGGVLVAVGIRAASEWLRKKTKISEGWAVLVVVLTVLALVVGIGFLLAPSVAREVAELQKTLPGAIERLRAWLGQSSWGQRLLPVLAEAESSSPKPGELLETAGTVLSATLGLVGSGVLLLVVGLYLAADPMPNVDGVLRLFPAKARDRARSIAFKMGETLRHWLIGQLAAMTAVGILTGVGLAVLGVPMAPILGLLAAIFDFVPNFGPFIAGFPAVLLALTVSPATALYVVLLYFVIQQIEGNLISPLIQEKQVSLPPVITLVTQVIFGVVAGPLGLIMATPLAAVIFVLVRELVAIRDGTATAPTAAPE